MEILGHDIDEIILKKHLIEIDYLDNKIVEDYSNGVSLTNTNIKELIKILENYFEEKKCVQCKELMIIEGIEHIDNDYCSFCGKSRLT